MTTAAQWEHMAREANAAAVKAMAEADRLRAELAALRAAGGQEKPRSGCEWCNHAAHFPAACTKDAAPQHPDYECNCCGQGDSRPEVVAALAAAPVGGQAEPSDARKELRSNVHHNLQPLIGWVRWLVSKGENIRPQELPEYASRMWNVLDLVDDFTGEPRHDRPADVPGPLPGSGVAAAAVSGEQA